MHGGAQAGVVPIEKAPALAALVNVPAHTIEHHGALRGGVEFGTAPIATAGAMDVLPDPEDLVHGVEAVDLEFVIGIAAGDEHLDIVLFPDFRIAFGHGAPDVGLFDVEAEIE